MQLNDKNEQAAQQVSPTVKYAARTADIAHQEKEGITQKHRDIMKGASNIGKAVGAFVEFKQKGEYEERYAAAYLDKGAEEGLSEHERTQKRTGLTNFIYGGEQTPEYQGTLDRAAANTASSLYVELEAQLADGGYKLDGETWSDSVTWEMQRVIEDNFADAPDAKLAFLKNWQDKSNALSKEHFLDNLIHQQNLAKQAVVEGHHLALSEVKQLMGSDPDAATALADKMYDLRNRPVGMSEGAALEALIDASTSAAELEDVTAIQLALRHNLPASMDSKQRKAWTAAINKMDTNTKSLMLSAKNKLDNAAHYSTTPAEYRQAANTYAAEVKQIKGRNTGTASYMSATLGSDRFLKQYGNEYKTAVENKRNEMHREREDTFILDISEKHDWLAEQGLDYGDRRTVLMDNINKTQATIDQKDQWGNFHHDETARTKGERAITTWRKELNADDKALLNPAGGGADTAMAALRLEFSKINNVHASFGNTESDVAAIESGLERLYEMLPMDEYSADKYQTAIINQMTKGENLLKAKRGAALTEEAKQAKIEADLQAKYDARRIVVSKANEGKTIGAELAAMTKKERDMAVNDTIASLVIEGGGTPAENVAARMSTRIEQERLQRAMNRTGSSQALAGSSLVQTEVSKFAKDAKNEQYQPGTQDYEDVVENAYAQLRSIRDVMPDVWYAMSMEQRDDLENRLSLADSGITNPAQVNKELHRMKTSTTDYTPLGLPFKSTVENTDTFQRTIQSMIPDEEGQLMAFAAYKHHLKTVPSDEAMKRVKRQFGGGGSDMVYGDRVVTNGGFFQRTADGHTLDEVLSIMEKPYYSEQNKTGQSAFTSGLAKLVRTQRDTNGNLLTSLDQVPGIRVSIGPLNEIILGDNNGNVATITREQYEHSISKARSAINRRSVN
jgi:hypothetical protein